MFRRLFFIFALTIGSRERARLPAPQNDGPSGIWNRNQELVRGLMKQLLQRKVLWFGLAFVLIGIGCNRFDRPAQIQTDTAPEYTAEPSSVTRTTSYAPVVKSAAPAVVTIRSARQVRAPQQFPFMNDPRFREFFGDRFGGENMPQQQPPQLRRGLGSGVIVSPDGIILTNHHVIDGAEEIKVVLNDRRGFDARVIGSDPPSDLAVLKIEATGLPTLSFGDSEKVQIGDVVLAVGNPLGIGQTVTAGIISAKGRSTGLSDGSFEDFLQTDAPINQGNSGGALINTEGELIGINSQIVSPSGGNIGIGFAIPTSMVKPVMDQLVSNGTVRRGQLGVVVQPVTSDIARNQELSEARGVIVAEVQPGSAADQAGLRQGDIIVAFNGVPVNESNELRNRVAASGPGAEVTLAILRDGSEQQLSATLSELTARSR